nr:sugar ABC transporter permease [Suipraeoptans intestinalis]
MFLAVFLYPIIRTVLMSFFKIESVTDTADMWQFVGISNYEKLLSTDIFRTAMWNIGRIWLFGGLIVMLLSLLLGVILTSGIKGKKVFRAIIYLPNIVSAVALATMWLQYVYSPKFGLLKSVLEFVGLDKLAKTQWTAPDNVFWALLIAYCFGMVGYHMLIWMSGIERISPDFYEAATIDGANKPQQFRYMTLPLLKGVFKTNITMWSVSTGGIFLYGSQLFLLSGAYGPTRPAYRVLWCWLPSNLLIATICSALCEERRKWGSCGTYELHPEQWLALCL